MHTQSVHSNCRPRISKFSKLHINQSMAVGLNNVQMWIHCFCNFMLNIYMIGLKFFSMMGETKLASDGKFRSANDGLHWTNKALSSKMLFVET